MERSGPTLEPLLREIIGQALREERHAQGRTLADVAARSGVSMQHLSDVERGRKDASSEVLAAVLGALGLSAWDLPALLAPRPMLLDLTEEPGIRPLRPRTAHDLVGHDLAEHDLAGHGTSVHRGAGPTALLLAA